jgi:hypothetical protein
MTTLANNKARNFKNEHADEFAAYPVEGSETIYQGSLVGGNGSGYAQPLEAGDEFWGIATRKADNSDGSAGDINVEVKTKFTIVVDVTGASAVTDVNTDVYASDDDTFTLTTTSNTKIGKVVEWISGTECVVRCEGSPARSI